MLGEAAKPLSCYCKHALDICEQEISYKLFLLYVVTLIIGVKLNTRQLLECKGKTLK